MVTAAEVTDNPEHQEFSSPTGVQEEPLMEPR
jgi:hypothetical protein